MSDLELQEDLLKVENLNLEEAEKLAVAKESAKNRLKWWVILRTK